MRRIIEQVGKIAIESEVDNNHLKDGASKLRAIAEWLNDRPEKLNANKSLLELIVEFNKEKKK